MTVLAFLQNQWVRDPERVRALIERYGESYRRRLIPYALFAGCLTGRRLQAAFGPVLCSRITWEEASPVVTGSPRECPPADPAHIRAALERHQPGIVLAFGKIAAEGVRPLWTGNLIVAPHPAARDPFTPDRLRQAAEALQIMLAN
jgi:hypothetical protein